MLFLAPNQHCRHARKHDAKVLNRCKDASTQTAVQCSVDIQFHCNLTHWRQRCICACCTTPLRGVNGSLGLLTCTKKTDGLQQIQKEYPGTSSWYGLGVHAYHVIRWSPCLRQAEGHYQWHDLWLFSPQWNTSAAVSHTQTWQSTQLSVYLTHWKTVRSDVAM